jgi:hypothetical protein
MSISVFLMLDIQIHLLVVTPLAKEMGATARQDDNALTVVKLFKADGTRIIDKKLFSNCGNNRSDNRNDLNVIIIGKIDSVFRCTPDPNEKSSPPSPEPRHWPRSGARTMVDSGVSWTRRRRTQANAATVEI